MNYKELVLLVRPGAVEKMGGIIDENRRVIGHNWQSAFESLPAWEQAKAYVLDKWPDAVVMREWDFTKFVILSGLFSMDLPSKELGKGDAPESAWLDAEKNLK